MNDKRCQETRSKLHALRAGELARLERRAVETHLAGCQSCTAELWLQAELEDAAERGPAPLSDQKKRELFTGIQRQLLGVPRPTAAPAFAWPRLRPLAFAGAAAMVLVLVGVIALPRQLAPEPVPTVARGWVANEADVQAFAATVAAASFSREARQPRLLLNDGTLVVRFERRPDSEPLEVETPDLRVIVRGTVLMVSVSAGRSTVSVQHGRVEVVLPTGDTLFVTDGEKAESTGGGLSRETATTEQRRQMAEVFAEEPPSPAVTAPAPPPTADAPPVPAPPKPAWTPPAKPTIAPAPPPDPVELARGRWRAGDPTAALAELEALLTSPDLGTRRREEALYLAATIQRELKLYGDAAGTFAELMRSEAATTTVRLARLERARILAAHLDDKPQALSELALLAQDGATDAVADAATFERCAILIEERALTPARACLTDYLARFDNGSHVGECAILLDRLSGKGSRP